MASKKKAKRTVLYSSAGRKLYAKRDAQGQFRDIQSYQRAHAADLKRRARDEAPRKAAPKRKAVAGTPAVTKAPGRKPAKQADARKAPARKK